MIIEMNSVNMDKYCVNNKSNKNNSDNSKEDSTTIKKGRVKVRNLMHMHSRWMVSKNHQLLTIWCTHAVGHHQVCQLIYQGETQCFSKIDITQWKIRLQQQLIQDLKVNSWILWQNTSGLSNLQSKNYFSTRWLIKNIHYRHWIHGKRASGKVDYNLKK